MIRPTAWLEQHGVAAGTMLPLNIPELQVEGAAFVDSVEPCPPIAGGEGSVVTALFKTRQVDLIATMEVLGPNGQIETLSGTVIHPIWSVDRQDWIELGELQKGERLQAADGEAVVLSLSIHRSATPVYNIEIHGEHVYQVDSCGILAHNTYPLDLAKSTFSLPTTWRSAKGISGTFSDGKHTFRIDTHNLSPGERFHVHIESPQGKEIAVIQGRGTNGIWRESHRTKTLLKPSEVSGALRTDIRRLLRHALNNIE